MMPAPSSWKIINQKLYKEFVFNSFSDAMNFMNNAIPTIEEMDHHPEWSNIYNKVMVSLITHDEEKTTSLDHALAQYLDTLYDAQITAKQ